MRPRPSLIILRSMKSFHALVFIALLSASFCGCRSEAPPSSGLAFTEGSLERVGFAGPNRFITPANQILTPAGLQVELPGLRPQALALSPDGKILLTSGKTAEIVVVDPIS